jgi:hypothetical protein
MPLGDLINRPQQLSASVVSSCRAMENCVTCHIKEIPNPSGISFAGAEDHSLTCQAMVCAIKNWSTGWPILRRIE